MAPLHDYLFASAERYICKMYGDKNYTSVNTLRNKLFWKHYMTKGKIINLSLHPSSSSLRKHKTQVYYVANMWIKANIPMQELDYFTDYCWFPDGSIDWIDCPYPSDLADLFEKIESTE